VALTCGLILITRLAFSTVALCGNNYNGGCNRVVFSSLSSLKDCPGLSLSTGQNGTKWKDIKNNVSTTRTGLFNELSRLSRIVLCEKNQPLEFFSLIVMTVGSCRFSQLTKVYNI
jgi:hypothetical protein